MGDDLGRRNPCQRLEVERQDAPDEISAKTEREAGPRLALRVVVIAVCVALVAVPGAFAKGRIVVKVADRTPGVGDSFAVLIDDGTTVPEGVRSCTSPRAGGS